MDSLDQVLLSYVQSSHVQPLTPSRKVNLPKHDVKSLEFSCLTALDELLPNIDIQHVQSVHIKLQFLYSIYAKNYTQWLDVVKKHQLLIVQLFEKKQYDAIYDQLENAYQQISTRLNVSKGVIKLSEVVDGIPTVDCDPQLTQIIIAYHFFTLQWLAQSLAKNKLTKVQRMEVISRLPNLFLTTSNQRRWINRAPFNAKYEKNCIKLIQAFVKVLEKQKEVYALEITCLRIKLMEFTKEYGTDDIDMIPGVEPFVQDTKGIGRDLLQNTSSLDIKHAEIVSVSGTDVSLPPNASQLINDKRFLSSLKATNYNSVKAILDLFSKLDMKALSNQQMSLLDSVTLFCQSNLNPDLVPFLQQLYDIYNKYTQVKRIRNVSNLLFKLGSKTNDVNLLDLAVSYEFTILQHQPFEKHFENLVGKLKMVSQYSPCMMKVLLQACELCSKLASGVSLVVRMLSSNIQLVHCFNEVDEEFRFNLVIKLFKEIGSWKAQRTLICNAIVKGLNFSDSRLNSQVQLAYYNVGGIEYIDLKEPEDCSLLESIGIGITKMDVKGWSEDVLFSTCDSLNQWAQHSQQLDEFEISIIRSAILLLRFNGMDREVKSITETLLKLPLFNEQFKIFLHFQLCHVSAKLSNHTSWGDSLASLQHLISQTQHLRFQDVVNYKIESIKHYLVNNFKTAQDKFKSLISVLKSRPEFDLSQSKSFSIWDKLKNFLILAKSQFLTAQINASDGVVVHSCISKAIKILYLISKKCPDSDKSLANEIMWETNHLLLEGYNFAIDSLIDLGLSKNIPLYLKEWKKLNDSVEAPIVNQINRYKIQIFGSLSDSENFKKDAEDKRQFVKDDITVCYFKSVVDSLQVRAKAKGPHLDNPSLQVYPFLQFITPSHDFQQIETSFTHCINSLNDFKTFGSFPDCVQIFPSITVGEVALKPDAMQIFIELGKLKDLLLQKAQRLEFTIFQQRRLFYLLSQCVHLISSISAYRGKDLLNQLYFIQDWIKTKPFIDNKWLSTVDEIELIPDLTLLESKSSYAQQLSQFKSDLALLPSNWSVITIDICDLTGDLLLSKLRSDGRLPTFMRLSLTRFKQRESIKTLSFDEMKVAFKRIFQENRKSTLYSTTSLVKTIQDRKKWWKTRFTLDYELQDLLQHIEKFWFGGFQGIFEPVGSTFEEFKLDLIKILRTHVSDKIARVLALNDVIIECFYGMQSYDRGCVDDLLAFLMEILSFHLGVDTNRVNFEKLHTSIEYLLDKRKTDVSEHIVLIPSARCSFFPWESLKFLRNKSVSRMPSVSILVNALKTQAPVDKDCVFYLINPGGDLKTSQQRFEPLLEQCKTWKGVAGVRPDENKIVDDILDAKLFVYIGHGGCDQYIKPNTLFHATKHCNLPPSLLIGCSSGELHDHGCFEPSGGIFNWVNCGSPLVLANLWDVTDKDIDAFTISMFNKWGLTNDGELKVNIAEAVRFSREVCILKYLNGSAPVIYGLPLMTS
ncbi:ESP1 [Candida margitis]|uniref:ESP1 n=1 Tax=Candida margitis TaxID=1775924 RepID=UPI002225F111|nr:ESP1 [Candida margitis]KAI5961807.1 ESP1 [Candida margitis]